MKDEFKNIIIFSIAFVILDQVIKIFISSKMVLNQSFILIKNLLSLTLVHNTGAAFSLLSGSKYVLIAIGVAALLLLILYVRAQDIINGTDAFAYSLLFGGIIGNLIDRIVHGYVIDYISFNIGSYYFPIFNIADICIVLSIAIIILRTIGESTWK